MIFFLSLARLYQCFADLCTQMIIMRSRLTVSIALQRKEAPGKINNFLSLSRSPVVSDPRFQRPAELPACDRCRPPQSREIAERAENAFASEALCYSQSSTAQRCYCRNSEGDSELARKGCLTTHAASLPTRALTTTHLSPLHLYPRIGPCKGRRPRRRQAF